jgi:hypothetical protein
MGKSSRKLSKSNQKKQGIQKDMVLVGAQHKIQEFQADGQYDEALEKIIELLESENYNSDILFAAADTYFMAGDYDRSVVWVNKTLDFEPSNISARILLARICMLQERINDALNIIEFVLRTAGDKLQTVEKEQVEEILDYFRYTQDLEELAKSHPYAVDFMGGAVVKKKSEIEAAQTDNEVEVAVDESLLAEKKTNGTSDEKTPETIKSEILGKEVSLQEKVTLLNSFAGAYYYEHNNEAAKILLLAAKDLDGYNEKTIKNLIVLALDEKDKRLAVEYAALLGELDFSWLKKIRDN